MVEIEGLRKGIDTWAAEGRRMYIEGSELMEIDLMAAKPLIRRVKIIARTH
jgi:hypothetical protein